MLAIMCMVALRQAGWYYHTCLFLQRPHKVAGYHTSSCLFVGSPAADKSCGFWLCWLALMSHCSSVSQPFSQNPPDKGAACHLSRHCFVSRVSAGQSRAWLQNQASEIKADSVWLRKNGWRGRNFIAHLEWCSKGNYVGAVHETTSCLLSGAFTNIAQATRKEEFLISILIWMGGRIRKKQKLPGKLVARLPACQTPQTEKYENWKKFAYLAKP